MVASRPQINGKEKSAINPSKRNKPQKIFFCPIVFPADKSASAAQFPAIQYSACSYIGAAAALPMYEPDKGAPRALAPLTASR